MRQLLFLFAIGACGARGGASAERPSDPELLAIAHAWTIENHIVTPRSYLADSDAMEWHGHKVAITGTGYTTPFQGACKTATFERRVRALSEVAAEVDLAGESRNIPGRFGLPASVTEFKFVCSDRRDDGRLTLVPILTIFVGGTRAMTCFSGVCYLLTKE
jgi:hypothetical protein